LNTQIPWALFGGTVRAGLLSGGTQNDFAGDVENMERGEAGRK